MWLLSVILTSWVSVLAITFGFYIPYCGRICQSQRGAEPWRIIYFLPFTVCCRDSWLGWFLGIGFIFLLAYGNLFIVKGILKYLKSSLSIRWRGEKIRRANWIADPERTSHFSPNQFSAQGRLSLVEYDHSEFPLSPAYFRYSNSQSRGCTVWICLCVIWPGLWE